MWYQIVEMISFGGRASIINKNLKGGRRMQTFADKKKGPT